MNDVYNNPKYYEIAFSYRDIAAEVDVFEQVIKLFSHIPVSKVFEIGCGPAPHLEEITRRGYQYTGLDLNPAMLEYSRNKLRSIKLGGKTYRWRSYLVQNAPSLNPEATCLDRWCRYRDVQTTKVIERSL